MTVLARASGNLTGGPPVASQQAQVSLSMEEVKAIRTDESYYQATACRSELSIVQITKEAVV
jgi:hypothetical protein